MYKKIILRTLLNDASALLVLGEPTWTDGHLHTNFYFFSTQIVVKYVINSISISFHFSKNKFNPYSNFSLESAVIYKSANYLYRFEYFFDDWLNFFKKYMSPTHSCQSIGTNIVKPIFNGWYSVRYQHFWIPFIMKYFLFQFIFDTLKDYSIIISCFFDVTAKSMQLNDLSASIVRTTIIGNPFHINLYVPSAHTTSFFIALPIKFKLKNDLISK